MIGLAGLAFAAPWILVSLLALPILWFLLRAVPPAPRRQIFPAVRLLLGLKDDESVSDRTPWWLLLLRICALAAVIIGLAGPILNPSSENTGRGPVLVVLDASWAGAHGWRETREQLDGVLSEADRMNRPVAVLTLTNPQPPVFESARSWKQRLPGLTPAPWSPSADQINRATAMVSDLGNDFDTVWFSDALALEGAEDLLQALAERGEITVFDGRSDIVGLQPALFEDGLLKLSAQRSRAGAEASYAVSAIGPDPSGLERVLAAATLEFAGDATHTEVELSLPSELRARIDRFEIDTLNSAGAVSLTDDRLQRRKVALISSRAGDEALVLLSPLHYLRQALDPTAEILEGALSDLLPANPDVIVLADVARFPEDQENALVEWVEAGGMLLRFSGPRLAASDTARAEEEPLLPVRLRIGGRSVGGAMSWGEPKSLAPFASSSPFVGLTIPSDVTVSSQVMAQPDPTLANRVIAELSDGTPLVTRKVLGQGQIVLFHVTANAEWSNLPLSGLFVDMLDRLAISTAQQTPDEAVFENTVWQAQRTLDGFGRIARSEILAGVDGARLFGGALGPDMPPGLYQHETESYARNVLQSDTVLSPMQWPENILVRGYEADTERDLSGVFLGLAMLLLCADIIASLLVSGLLSLRRTAALCLPLVVVLSLSATPPDAQETDAHVELGSELRLAHIITGNAEVDRIAYAGLRGLGYTLAARTSVEPGEPVSVDLDLDELAFYPLLYWPVTANQPLPSSDAYGKLNAYLRTGGMILFDTRDGDLTASGANSPNSRRLQQLALPLDIPPIEPLPQDHVLTRTFYLLSDFPGRYTRSVIWVESAAQDAEQVEGLPFRNLNDGVSPIIIGGNDWAAAWAVDERNTPLFPIGRGYTGERQRELARRFGVNLVMHVLTGNYKSDQVHVPALLDRLGQ